MSKRVISLLLTLAALTAAVSAAADGEDVKIIDVIGGGSGPVSVTICDAQHYNSEMQGYDRIMFDADSEPFIDENGRTQMPVRAISDELGFDVDWNETEKKITLSKDAQTVMFSLNSSEFTAGGKTVTMDTAPVVKDGRTFVPLRFMAEAVGYSVEYTDRSLTENINSAETPIDDMWNFGK